MGSRPDLHDHVIDAPFRGLVGRKRCQFDKGFRALDASVDNRHAGSLQLLGGHLVGLHAEQGKLHDLRKIVEGHASAGVSVAQFAALTNQTLMVIVRKAVGGLP